MVNKVVGTKVLNSTGSRFILNTHLGSLLKPVQRLNDPVQSWFWSGYIVAIQKRLSSSNTLERISQTRWTSKFRYCLHSKSGSRAGMEPENSSVRMSQWHLCFFRTKFVADIKFWTCDLRVHLAFPCKAEATSHPVSQYTCSSWGLQSSQLRQVDYASIFMSPMVHDHC